MTDDPLKVCPECGKAIRRVLFPAGVVFKGSGFYVTDHGGSHANGHSESKKPEGSSTEKPSESNGNGSKPAGESSTGKTSGESSASKSSGESAANVK